jgi:hypothetical protein
MGCSHRLVSHPASGEAMSRFQTHSNECFSAGCSFRGRAVEVVLSSASKSDRRQCTRQLKNILFFNPKDQNPVFERYKKSSLTSATAALLLCLGAGCSSNPPVPRDATAEEASVSIDVPVDMAPPRCMNAMSCAGSPGRPICDTATGQCVSCMSMASACSAGTYCNAATGGCDRGCSTDMGCAATGDAGVAGDGGVAATRCDPITHTCVACVTNDHCPPGNLCRGSTCVPGCSAMRPCATGQSCCDNACVDTATNIAACGACGTTCNVANGRAVCVMGACGVGMCTAPYENCDRNSANGCESNTQTDTANCGMCGRACEGRANATATCTMGTCGVRCNDGFADCDGDAANGCETDTRTSTTHCGRCGRSCAAAGGTAICTDSVCGVGMCGMGFEDCDGNAANGCETNVNTSSANCGRCGTVAPSRPNATGVCVAGVTRVVCNEGFGDCDGMAANGCETNLNDSVGNCGRCATACPGGTQATAVCAAGTCALRCNAGFGNCDGMSSNGCEANLNTDISNCNACRSACIAGPSSRAACTMGTCSITCSTGFSNCNSNPADGCEVDTRVAPTNCGTCGTVCPAGQVCNDGACVAPCPGIQTRCGGTCVALLTSNTNCGGCGTICPSGSTCTDGLCRCAIGTDPIIGVRCGAACVNVLTDNANCGTCGSACATGNTCVRGVCRCSISGVPIGVSCGSVCADLLSDARNCGACGRACTGGTLCSSGICR